MVKEGEQPKKASFLKSLLSGGFGGMCLVITGQPFDLVKVRLQTSNLYSGALDCFRKTVQKDGLKGLYRGMSAPLVGVTPIFAICFWGYDMGQRIARKAYGQSTTDITPLTTSQILFAGGFSAIPATVIMAPGERIKVLLQIQGQETKSGMPPKYNGAIDVVVKLFREGGIKSIFKGTFATLLRDVPGSMAYFGGYEAFKKMLTPKDSHGTLHPLSILFAGGMAGICNWAVAIPADVIKSRLQSAPEGMYKGLGDVLKTLLKEEGIKGLFKGFVPLMARAFPANAACFLGVEFSRKFFDILW